MRNEMLLAYWAGAEPTGPDHSPTLTQIPDAVDVVILFAVQITEDGKGNIDFNGLVDKNDQATIKGWIKEIRKRQEKQLRKTKFLLCIFSDMLAAQDPDAFAQKTKAAVKSWGVDGIDIDCETLEGRRSIIDVVQAIKNTLPPGSLLTTTIWAPWDAEDCQLFKEYTDLFDYIMTMDYTPYPGYKETIRLYESFAKKMGGDAAAYGKLAFGVSCMEFHNANHTPLEDVKKFCAYEPPVKGARKLGVMLFTLSYDAPGHGSPCSLFTYTNTIAEKLP
jgi:Glycosyl hydrolases family 18